MLTLSGGLFQDSQHKPLAFGSINLELDADGQVVVNPHGQVLSNIPAVPTGNNLTTILTVCGNTVQPSTAQLAGLVKYLALIQSASNTSTVETALTAL